MDKLLASSAVLLPLYLPFTQYARDRSLDIDSFMHHSDNVYYRPTSRCLQSCVACESVNYTIDSKVDFTNYDGLHSLDFSTLSATVHDHRKVELSLIWAQVALCKLTTGADLTVVNSICIQYKGRQLLLHGRNSAIFAWIFTHACF